jgi:hypothetical protein
MAMTHTARFLHRAGFGLVTAVSRVDTGFLRFMVREKTGKFK